MLFAGCAGITHEPKVDMSVLPVVDDAAFLNALNSIGIEEADVRTMSDTSFSFSDNDTDYKVVINLDATSEKNNQFSYSQCADEKTARELFDYYYDNYDHLFDAEEFSGHRVLIKRGPGNRGPTECGTTPEATSGMSS